MMQDASPIIAVMATKAKQKNRYSCGFRESASSHKIICQGSEDLSDFLAWERHSCVCRVLFGQGDGLNGEWKNERIG